MVRSILAAFILLSSSFAQNLGTPVNATFYADDVQTHQGKINIDPGSTTILRFYDDITFAFSRRSDILKAVPKGNDLVLYSTAEKAETDLSVLCDGKWHFFLIRIAKGTGLKFYEVKQRSEPAQAPSSSQRPVPASSPVSNVAASAAALVSPNWLKFEVRPLLTSSQELRLSYTLENTGDKRVVVSDNSLRVLRNGQPLEFSLENNGKQILDPGELFTGVIRIKAGAGCLTLQWGLRELGSQTAFVVQAELK